MLYRIKYTEFYTKYVLILLSDWMVKVLGMSDAEKDFIGYMEGQFKEVAIDSFMDFQEFSRYPLKIKKLKIDEIENKIKTTLEDIKETRAKITSTYDKIRLTNYRIGKKVNTLKKVYGQLKTQIRTELNYLQNQKRTLEINLIQYKEDVCSYEISFNQLKDRKREVIHNLDCDIEHLKELKKDYEVKNRLKGTWGEKEVIEHIKESFKDKKNWFLINSFNLDTLGKAIHFGEKTITENKIDHVFLGPKGLFILETKSWSTVTDEGVDKVENQLKKSKITFDKFFGDYIEINAVEPLLVCTEKHISLPENSEYVSIPLRKLSSYIDGKNDVFTNDEVFLIMNLLYPHLDNDHLGGISIKNIKFRGLLAKTKKYLKKGSSNKLLGNELRVKKQDVSLQKSEKTYNFPCPQCNANVTVNESSTKLKCPHCGFKADLT